MLVVAGLGAVAAAGVRTRQTASTGEIRSRSRAEGELRPLVGKEYDEHSS